MTSRLKERFHKRYRKLKATHMAWPNDMERLVTDDITITELWMVRERMKAGHFKVIKDSGFAEFSSFVVELNSGEQYEIDEFVDEVLSVTKVK